MDPVLMESVQSQFDAIRLGTQAHVHQGQSAYC